MSREKLLTVAVLVLFVLNIGILLFLFFAPKPGRPPGPELFEVIEEQLQFTEEQKTRFHFLRDEHRASINALNDKFSNTFNQYLLLLKEEKIDSAQQVSFETELSTLERTKAQITLNHFKQVKQLCLPEQQQRFDALVPQIARFITQEPRRPRH